jgi:dolichol-phosphate mannosyltransferase
LSRSLSLVIPTYNERDNVATLVAKINDILSAYDYEVVFIDDDSQDGTAEAIRELGRLFPVRVVVRRGKKGLASAVVDGIGEADSDIIGVMDADLQHPPEVIPGLFRALASGADIAIGSRYVAGGGCTGGGLARRIISRGAILIARLYLPETRAVRDPMSGFFMFKRPVVVGVELRPTGYKILLEILVRGKYQKLVEVPYWFRSRQVGKSKLDMKQQWHYMKHIYSLMNRGRESLRFGKFLLVGGSGVLVNEGILWLLTAFASLPYYISALFGIEASIISNFVFNDYFTFADRRTGQSFLRRLLKFNVTCLAGAGIQYGLLLLFTSVFNVHYLLSNLIGIAVATLWNYFINLLWTWR